MLGDDAGGLRRDRVVMQYRRCVAMGRWVWCGKGIPSWLQRVARVGVLTWVAVCDHGKDFITVETINSDRQT